MTPERPEPQIENPFNKRIPAYLSSHYLKLEDISTGRRAYMEIISKNANTAEKRARLLFGGNQVTVEQVGKEIVEELSSDDNS